MLSDCFVNGWAECEILEQQSQIVEQLQMGSTITPHVVKWLANTIRKYYGQLAPDWTIEFDSYDDREPSAPTLFYFVKQVDERGPVGNE
jgi:hypothetical protein